MVRRRRIPLTLLCAFAALAGLLGGGLRLAIAAGPASTEYEIKAAFLLHFSRFVEWPASAFAASNAPLFICVLGDDPFGSILEEIVRNEMLDSHPIAVGRYYQSADQVDRCHILFVGRVAKPLERRIFDQLHGKNILTVSDAAAFAPRGGVIGFVVVDGKIKLQVNRASAERAELRISSKLLRLADNVG